MASLAEIKTQSGKAGGELQQEDVKRLRKEVELKMEKLNEIRKVCPAVQPFSIGQQAHQLMLLSNHTPSEQCQTLYTWSPSWQ